MNSHTIVDPNDTAEVVEQPADDASEFPEELLRLHVFQPLAAKVLQISEESQGAVQEFESLIRADQALAAELLHQANSALFALASKVHSVRQAILLLGLERLKTLVLRASMETFLSSGLQLKVVRQCWLHSLATAELCAKLARFAGLQPDHAYMCGLLHDIGRLALLKCYPNKITPMLSAQYQDAAEILAAERRLRLPDHCHAGSQMMARWGFPQELRKAAKHHHDAPEGGKPDLLCLVQLGCKLAGTVGFETIRLARREPYEEVLAQFPAALRSRFDFTVEELEEEIISKVQALDR